VQQAVDLLGGHFQAQAVGFTLHHLAELDLHATRQADAVFLLEQVGDAAFARLAVDADHRFVAAADVGRVDRQVRHFPQLAFLLLGEALADGVLVRAGERGVDQVADVRVTWVHRHLVALFDDLAHAVDVGEVQLRVDALGVEVQRQGHQVDVTGALAVAEQAAFDAVGAGHQAQLGGGDAGATVVVGVQADDHAVAAADIAAEPFDLVGVDVRRGTSTVAGRLRMILCSGVGFHTSITASQTSLANSSSVALKVSGEYWKVHWVSGCWAAYLTNSLAAFTAMSLTPCLSWLKTMRRNDGQVALYRWTMAFFAPRRDSKVRAIRSSRPG
jgi:hypothetical protein